MTLITDKWIGTEYFKIYDFNHIEFYVGNAKQSLYYYCLVMGFKLVAYKGPETGNKDFSSYVLKNFNNVTGPLINSASQTLNLK